MLPVTFWVLLTLHSQSVRTSKPPYRNLTSHRSELASIGMAPGICLYVLFGVVAFISGIMINRIYLRIDSVRYPITLYGDMCERTVGSWLKYSAFFSSGPNSGDVA